MQILFANWTRRRSGGAETYLERVMPLFIERGHSLAYAFEVDEPNDRASLELPRPCLAVQLTAVGAIERLRAWRPDVIYVHGLLDPDVERWLLDVGPAVLFAHSYYGTCISGEKTHKFPVVRPCGRQFGAPCLALYFPRRCGGLSPPAMLSSYRRQKRRLALLDQYDAVVTPSEHMTREFLNHNAASGRVFTAPHGIDSPVGGDVQAYSRLRAEPDTVVRFAQIGRMDHLKGGHVLLDALPLVQAALGRSAHVTFVGDGPARAAWEIRANEVSRAAPGISVEFVGWLQEDDLTRRLSAADVVVMPSLWPEPFGLVGLEANRLGIPVVAFATGGIPQWLRDGVNGCLAPGEPPRADGLAAALVRCVRSLESGDELPLGALAAAGQHRLERHVDAVVDVLASTALRRR
jgi:glycosyltransferase involved in cell wall biosynthesis